MDWSWLSTDGSDGPNDIVFRVHYNGMFFFDPLVYDQGRVVEMDGCSKYRVLYTHLLNMLATKVLRRLGSIFTSVYAAVHKLKKDSWLELQFSLIDNSKLNVNKFEEDNTPNVILLPWYSASKIPKDQQVVAEPSGL
ncbi:hypothetical protein Tco_1329017 [Tanacetum coccineum]